MGQMTPKKMKYNLHYGEVRGYVRRPHTAKPVSPITNRKRKRKKKGYRHLLFLHIRIKGSWKFFVYFSPFCTREATFETIMISFLLSYKQVPFRKRFYPKRFSDKIASPAIEAINLSEQMRCLAQSISC